MLAKSLIGGVLVLVTLSACAAVSNPDREELRKRSPLYQRLEAQSGREAYGPVAPEPEPKPGPKPVESPAGNAESASVGSAAIEASDEAETPSAVAAQSAEESEPQGGATEAEPQVVDQPDTVGVIAGNPIDSRDLLVRAWWRSGDQVREMLEQLVVEELVTAEARRQEWRIDPNALESRVDLAFGALDERIRRSGSDLAREDFVREVIGLDPAFYARQLRGDSIVQLLMERVVRTWVFENESAEVHLLSVPAGPTASETVSAIVAKLAAGEDFKTIAAEFAGSAGSPGSLGAPARMLVVKDDRLPVSSLAFETPIGEVAGPIEDRGQALFIKVQGRQPAWGGSLDELRGLSEASLAGMPVQDLEYLQWRSAMGRRYRIDLTPFQELVEGP